MPTDDPLMPPSEIATCDECDHAFRVTVIAEPVGELDDRAACFDCLELDILPIA